jgi:hypothetical protein
MQYEMTDPFAFRLILTPFTTGTFALPRCHAMSSPADPVIRPSRTLGMLLLPSEAEGRFFCFASVCTLTPSFPFARMHGLTPLILWVIPEMTPCPAGAASQSALILTPFMTDPFAFHFRFFMAAAYSKSFL